MTSRVSWQRLGSGLGVAGRVLGRAAASVGQGAAAAWKSVDPDVFRHVVQLPVMGLTMLGPSRPPLVALADDGHRPVLFVHGLGGNRGNFMPMRAWFRLSRRSRTYAVTCRADASWDELARDLCAAIAEITQCNRLKPDAKIDLVGHSMGGLVCRLALEDPATAARVACLVTLGTPHAGTHAARFAQTRLVRELRPDSGLMARLQRQTPWPGPPAMPRLISLWSHADMLLLPAGSACVAGAENVEMPGFTHYSYLLQAASWRRVLAVLAG